jgi:hypothetical protein
LAFSEHVRNVLEPAFYVKEFDGIESARHQTIALFRKHGGETTIN